MWMTYALCIGYVYLCSSNAVDIHSIYSDRWNLLDFVTLVLYLITIILRIITLRISTDVSENRPLIVSEYFYGFIAMFLALRAFGQVIERLRKMGTIQIALFFIMSDVLGIFWQFVALILAFALPITKIYIAEKAYTSGRDSAEDLWVEIMILPRNLRTHK